MRNFHKIFFALIMTVLIISPLAKVPVDYFNFTVMPLRGHIEYAEYPEFSWNGWFDGTYQDSYDKYLEDHIGLRNVFVRIHNQVDWSLYRKPSNKGIIAGKDDYLYEIDYIRAHLGETFIGQEAIDHKCSLIKLVQDKLDSLGTELIIVLAPGKASMFPEHIPERYLEKEPGTNNNEAYLARFKEEGIKHIDFHSHFRAMKDTSSYPLYHKCGIHWNIYGAYYALDSIVKYMEDVSGTDMTDMSYEGIEWSDVPRGSDYDVGNALNILRRIPDQPMPYHYGIKYNIKGKARPRLMVIADSYYWTIYNLQGSSEIWGEQDFRYYDMEVFSPGNPDKKLTHISIEELKKFDFIMVVYTEANMDVLANKFFEKSYTVLLRPPEIENIMARIRRDEKWLSSVLEKAERKGISLEKQIELDAMWIYNEEMEKQGQTINE